MDDLFEKAHRGLLTIVSLYWNVGEAAVVFDRYGEKLGLNAGDIFRTMLRELRMLCRARFAALVNVTPKTIRGSVELQAPLVCC